MTGEVRVETLNHEVQVVDIHSNIITPQVTDIQTVSVDVAIPGPQGPVGPYGRPRVANVAYAANLTINWTDVDVARIVLEGNLTLNFTGAYDGQKCLLQIYQNDFGGWNVTLPASVRFGTDLPNWTMSNAPDAQDKIGFIFDETAGLYDVVAIMKGF